MLLQLWANAKAAHGREAFEHSLGFLTRSPLIVDLLVAVPLVFHAGFGLWLALRSEYNVGRHPYSGNWTYLLQRMTGLVVLAFIAFHAARFWLPLHSEGATAGDVHTRLEALLSSTVGGVPFAALAYTFGIAACAFHLGNGLATCAVRFGVASSRPKRRAAAALGVVVGLVTFALGAKAVFVVATGWRLGGPS
jgi:succinate dehydrogenase / fumarate reductase cytochrome b subunit